MSQNNNRAAYVTEEKKEEEGSEAMPNASFPLELLGNLKLPVDSGSGYSYSPFQQQKKKSNQSTFLRLVGGIFRSLLLDLPLMLVFALYIATVLLHKIHDDYLAPQIELMKFLGDERDHLDTTYYHRDCDGRDVSATSINELIIEDEASTEDAMRHMLKHGVSMYPNLLTPETAWELREFIDEGNGKQEGFDVIENEHRYSWGIDVNMHPAINKFWKELASNEKLVKALQAIIGPDPAIIEFTAITSAYGAKDQHDHQDVIPPASGAKFARTFIPSYSLFIALQDTSYDMGATHVCPGTHICSSGCESHCPDHNLAVSGDDIWPQGWGALVNQQTTHKGMGHFKKGGLDRVVIIATFAPRPQTHRQVETRMLGQGGSYSLHWSQWGHTLSDYVHADTRMTEPQKTMRSLGIIKGGGWNLISVASMRISNDDNGYSEPWQVEKFLEAGGFWFLPLSWQDEKSKGEKHTFWKHFIRILETTKEKAGPILALFRKAGKIYENTGAVSEEPENVWHQALLRIVKQTESELFSINCLLLTAYMVVVLFLEICLLVAGRSNGSILLRSITRLVFTLGSVVLMAFLYLQAVEQSNWAKDIRSGNAYRLPYNLTENREGLPPATLPLESDILIAPDYASDSMASYSMLLEVAHPGNKYWKGVTREYAEGYVALPSSLKQKFCESILDWVLAERRFLIQDQERQWTASIETKDLHWFCHRELMSASYPILDALIRQLDSLKADIKFGRWDDKVIHEKIMASYLETWEHRFVPQIEKNVIKPKSQKIPYFWAGGGRLLMQSSASKTTFARANSLPPAPTAVEPYPGAWLKEGDVVESKYRCSHNEWYRGKIYEVVADKAIYNVVYDDGEVDESLSRYCIRPFRPYAVNEEVEVTDGVGSFVSGKILREYEGELYDVFTVEGVVMNKTMVQNIRRFEKEPDLEVDMAVMARFGGGEQWFPGRVLEIRADETVAIEYDDGDYEPALSIAFVRPII